MKKTFGVLAIYATLAIVAPFAISELKAQTPAASPAAAAPAQGTCTDEAKTPLYADFMKFRTTDTPKAYDAAKKYLAICTQDDQYTSYLKKWAVAFEKEDRKTKFQAVLYGDKKYTEAFAMGKQILADEPENLRVMIDLGYTGYNLAAPATKNESFNIDSLNYSRRAIQLLEAGKQPTSLDGKAGPWDPFKGKDDTLAYLYRGVGRVTLKTKPEEALAAFIKALSFETDLKKEAWEYYFVAAAYETGPYPRLSESYKVQFAGKDETPESKLALENINQIIDRMIDAYARAVSLAGNDPKYAAPKKAWMDGLSTWYKFRHNESDAGLNELIASVMSKPLPPVPTPITVLPTAPATSTTTPATGTPGAGAGNGAPTATKPATVPGANAMTTTPKSTTTTPTTTAKPKPKNNHPKAKARR